MTIDTAIVPVAGLGTRLLPITRAVPKELLPLGGKPTLHYVIEELWDAGIRRTILVTSPEKSRIAESFHPAPELEQRLLASGKPELAQQLWSHSPAAAMQLETVIQTEQHGLGHAVAVAEPMVGEQPVVVSLGDCVLETTDDNNVIQRMIEAVEKHQADIVITFEQVPPEKVSRFGIAKPRTQGPIFELDDLIEKPSIEEAPSHLAVAARYVFSAEIFQALRETPRGKGNEIQLTDAIRQMIQSGAKAIGIQLNPGERRFDVGNLHSYTESFIHFALADPQLRERVIQAVERKGNARETR
ncbi:MAG: NTP transferase domain-containing protein [Mariniblastus sp.]|nr:NTP transferase domain-containing protein [Mariniblastus sp.]